MLRTRARKRTRPDRAQLTFDDAFENATDWVPVASAKYTGIVRDIIAGADLEDYSLVALCTLYGLASICYYRFDQPVMPDSEFDNLCSFLSTRTRSARLQKVYPALRDREALASGSGYHLADVSTLPPHLAPLHDIAEVMLKAVPATVRVARVRARKRTRKV